MKKEEVIEKLTSKAKGTFCSVSTAKAVTAKDGRVLLKTVRFTGQVGVNYANLSRVRQAVANGIRKAPKAPKWAEGVFFNGLRMIQHKKTKSLYLPFSFVQSKTKWTDCLGRSVDINDFDLYSRDKANRSSPKEGQAKYVNLKIENIFDIC
jgi:hypothetical protein